MRHWFRMALYATLREILQQSKDQLLTLAFFIFMYDQYAQEINDALETMVNHARHAEFPINGYTEEIDREEP